VRDEALQKLTKLFSEGKWIEVKSCVIVDGVEEQVSEEDIKAYRRKLLRMLWEGLFFGKLQEHELLLSISIGSNNRVL
jgi:hypothetical protein